MKQRKHRGIKKFIINFLTRGVTGRLSPRQSLAAEGSSPEMVLKGFMAFRAPESVIVTSVIDVAKFKALEIALEIAP